MARETVVISIGGSILIPGRDDADYIGRLASMLDRTSEEVGVAIVCGGGKIARYYTTTGRALGGSEYDLDVMGIGATRLNARLLAIALGGKSSQDIPSDTKTAADRAKEVPIVVMGGTEPGHTTDAVAAMLARDMGASRLVNATSVDAVYSEDPRENLDAERYTDLTIGELGNLVYKDHCAGKSSVFDPLGVEIAEREGIDIQIVDGRNLEELEKAVLGRPFSGTYVRARRVRSLSRGFRNQGFRQSGGGAPPRPRSSIFYV